MWRKSIALIVASIIILACGLSETLTPVPVSQESASSSQENTATPAESNQGENSAPVEEIIISKDSLETTPPKDIIQEISYFGGLGGGCGKLICECEFYEHTSPSLFTNEETIEFLSDINFEVCGLQNNEPIAVTVELPDQTRKLYSVSSYANEGNYPGFMIDFQYTPALPASPGSYHFIFSGNNWTFDQYIEVFDTAGPRLFLDNQGNLTFYNFKSNENVRLFAYESGLLIGWKELQVSQNGNLTLPTTITADFIAVGEVSGQVFDQEQGQFPPDWAWLGTTTDIYCNGSLNPIGIKPGEYAEVLVESLPTYKYEYGSRSLLKEGNLKFSQGTIVEIKSNAICDNGDFLWHVSCVNYECEGVIPEAGASGPYLRPIEELPSVTLDVPSLKIYEPIKGCAASRIHTGDIVTLEKDIDYVSIRSEPDTRPSDNKIGKILPGDQAKIIGGPKCNYDWIIWEVKLASDGLTGWVPESDGNEFWLVPIK